MTTSRRCVERGGVLFSRLATDKVALFAEGIALRLLNSAIAR